MSHRILSKKLIAYWAARFTLDARLRSKATKKNHKHVIGQQFKSNSPFDVTPAEYRHGHFRMVNGKLLKPKKYKKRKEVKK